MRSRLFTACLLAGLLSAMAAAPLAAQDEPAVPPPQELRLGMRTIHDATNRANVVTFLVPDGWLVDSRIEWRADPAQPVNVTAIAVDPDTGLQVRWLPAEPFVVAPPELIARDNPPTTAPSTQPAPATQPVTLNGVQVLDAIPDARTFVEQVLLPRFEGVEDLSIISVCPLPTTTRTYDARVRDLSDGAITAGDQLDVSVTRIRLQFTVQQRQWEEDLYLALIVWRAQWMTEYLKAMNIEGTFAMISVDRLFSVRAPRGELDDATPRLLSVALSPRPTIEWTELMLAVMEQRQPNRPLPYHRIVSRREKAESYVRQIRNHEARLAWAIITDIPGMAIYGDPTADNEQVLLSDGLANVWSDGNGGYVLADDDTAQPAQNNGVLWVKLNGR